MEKKFHLEAQGLLKMVQLEAGSLGKYSVVPGPVGRLKSVNERLKDPLKDFSFSGIEMYTGEFNDILVTSVNSDMYAPPAAIAAEILAAGGTETIIRVGSCGAMKKDIAVGDIIIVTGCIRGDGTSRYYVPDNFSTVADTDVTVALIQACENYGIKYHKGIVWSTDALLRESFDLINEMCSLNTACVDMVSSSLLTVAQLKGLRAGAILAVSDNLITGELGFVSPDFYKAESQTIDIAFEAIKILEAKK
jgi:uridine phosphorylase